MLVFLNSRKDGDVENGQAMVSQVCCLSIFFGSSPESLIHPWGFLSKIVEAWCFVFSPPSIWWSPESPLVKITWFRYINKYRDLARNIQSYYSSMNMQRNSPSSIINTHLPLAFTSAESHPIQFFFNLHWYFSFCGLSLVKKAYREDTV